MVADPIRVTCSYLYQPQHDVQVQIRSDKRVVSDTVVDKRDPCL